MSREGRRERTASDGSREGGFAVINVTNGTNVDMRFVTFERLLFHHHLSETSTCVAVDHEHVFDRLLAWKGDDER